MAGVTILEHASRDLSPGKGNRKYDPAVLTVLGFMPHTRPMTKSRQSIRQALDTYKITKGCAECGYKGHAAALQFDHIDPATKYRTASGKVVHPSDMVGRYSVETIIAEIAKCRVVCANCHAIHTHTVQR